MQRQFSHLWVSVLLLFFALEIPTAAAVRIEKNVYLIPGAFPKDQQPDGNSVVLLAPKGLIVIDTGRHAAHTQKIIDFAKEHNNLVAAIINTHWHLDHIGGNVLLRNDYPAAQVYASDALQNALHGFLNDYRQNLRRAIEQAKPSDDVAAWRSEIYLIDAGDKLAPTQVVDKSGRKNIAGRKLSLHLEHAATAGDVWIEDPAIRIVISGDLVTLPVPFFDTACPKQWEDALNHIAAVRFKTLIPGHGKPMTPLQFDTYRRAFSSLLKCAASDQPNVTCTQQWLSNANDLIESDDRARAVPMLDYYLKSILRSPAEQSSYCH